MVNHDRRRGRTTGRRDALALFGAAGVTLLGACTSQGAPATTTTGSAQPTMAAGGAPAAVRKVNANTASQAEVEQALQAAGVPNAARWAREVTEYRPYPANDPSFAKLRGELAKYNPSPEVVEQIISALSL